ncbi:MAG: hypothetical protein ACJ798_15125 [Phenylobacterium sp.]
MTTLTEIVASVVVHSSAVALSHFGVVLEPTQMERQPAPVERVVARSPSQPRKAMKLSACPEHQPAPHRIIA